MEVDVLRVTDSESGLFAVGTVSGSTYLLDLDGRTVRRIRVDHDPWHQLRRDGEEIRLLEIIRCVIREPMVLIIDLQVPGVAYTTRETSDVRVIRRLDRADGVS